MSFMNSLYNAYSLQIRDVLGSCMVPFIAANAIFGFAKTDQLSKDSKHLFVYLVCIFSLSVFVYCIVSINVNTFTSSLQVSEEDAVTIKATLTSVSDSYLKETLTFIALILGISLRSNDKNLTDNKDKDIKLIDSKVDNS